MFNIGIGRERIMCFLQRKFISLIFFVYSKEQTYKKSRIIDNKNEPWNTHILSADLLIFHRGKNIFVLLKLT